MLTNRKPAYSLAGGLYEALVDTKGEMYGVTNEEAKKARILFEELEEIDISPASGIATGARFNSSGWNWKNRQKGHYFTQY